MRIFIIALIILGCVLILAITLKQAIQKAFLWTLGAAVLFGLILLLIRLPAIFLPLYCVCAGLCLLKFQKLSPSQRERLRERFRAMLPRAK